MIFIHLFIGRNWRDILAATNWSFAGGYAIIALDKISKAPVCFFGFQSKTKRSGAICKVT